MSAAIAILDLLKELSALAVEVVRATERGEDLRVEDVLGSELQTTIAKGLADARARLKYGPPA